MSRQNITPPAAAHKMHAKLNHFLASLPAKDSKALLSDGEIVDLKLKTRLYHDGGPAENVYFPIDCVISILVGVEGSLLEMATIGHEGMVGAPAILDDGRTVGTAIVQLAGSAIRIDMKIFQRALSRRPAVAQLLKRSLHALLFQIMQSGACHHLHTVEQRCARWLLLMNDGAGSPTFLLTQEFLSEMICVRRASVNLALGVFRKAGYIRYVRGKVTVIDWKGLESASCECYRLIREEYAHLDALNS